MIAVGTFAIGLLALIGGAELVVRGSSRIAARFGISPMVIGVTIVAIGTSAPELAIGIDAALRGSGSLAVGNIAGTNTLNLLLILGLVALIRPLKLRSQTLLLDLPVIVGAAVRAHLDRTTGAGFCRAGRRNRGDRGRCGLAGRRRGRPRAAPGDV